MGSRRQSTTGGGTGKPPHVSGGSGGVSRAAGHNQVADTHKYNDRHLHTLDKRSTRSSHKENRVPRRHAEQNQPQTPATEHNHRRNRSHGHLPPAPPSTHKNALNSQMSTMTGAGSATTTSSSQARSLGPEEVSEEAVLAEFGYQLLPGVLGKGRYSRVRLAHDLRSGYASGDPRALAAVKVIKLDKVSQDFSSKFLPREVDLWSRLAHPNLVRMLASFQQGRVMCLSMEYVSNGDLLTYVQSRGALPEPNVRYWMWQLIDAVRYMHNQQIAHRDLKLENILISAENSLKIADFGFSRSTSSAQELSVTFCGSKSYSSPEILSGVAYDTFKADVWSLGVVGYILCTNKMPFNEHVGHNNMIVQAQRTRAYHYSHSLALTNYCTQLLDYMMTFKEQHRPTLEQVVLHPWWLLPLTQGYH